MRRYSSVRRSSRIAGVVVFLSGVCLLSNTAFAEGAIPTISPDSQHVVSFTYNPETVFAIKTRVHMVTDLRLAPGEQLEELVLGNTSQWITAKAPGNVFLKPTAPGLETSGTMVTNLHTYQLIITSSKNHQWYQQVSWMSGPMVAIQDNNVSPYMPPALALPAATPSTKPATGANQEDHGQQTAAVQAMSNLHFNYRIEGNAAFRPTEVFNNGTFTWIRMPRLGNAPMPALFVEERGTYSIANYWRKGDYLVVQQLFHKAILRIGDEKVTLINASNGNPDD